MQSLKQFLTYHRESKLSMTSFKSLLMSSGAVGLLFLGACSSGNQTANTTSSPAASPSVAASPSNATSSTTGETKAESGHTHGGEPGKPMQGGQVIESGSYHLELVTLKEAEGTHLDFYLQKGDTHEAIPGAKVTAQIQLPDGSQKALDMEYDAQGEHYYTVLPGSAAGEYKVAILSDVNGEKVNGRFSFKQ